MLVLRNNPINLHALEGGMGGIGSCWICVAIQHDPIPPKKLIFDYDK